MITGIHIDQLHERKKCCYSYISLLFELTNIARHRMYRLMYIKLPFDHGDPLIPITVVSDLCIVLFWLTVHQTTIRSWPRRPLYTNNKIIRKMLFTFLSSNLISVIISEMSISDNSILNIFNNNSAVGSEDLINSPNESSDIVCLVFMSSILTGL